MNITGVLAPEGGKEPFGHAQVELQAWRKLNEQTAELTAKPGYFAEEGVEQVIGLIESFYVSDCLWNLTANRNDSGTLSAHFEYVAGR